MAPGSPEVSVQSCCGLTTSKHTLQFVIKMFNFSCDWHTDGKTSS